MCAKKLLLVPGVTMSSMSYSNSEEYCPPESETVKGWVHKRVLFCVMFIGAIAEGDNQSSHIFLDTYMLYEVYKEACNPSSKSLPSRIAARS